MEVGIVEGLCGEPEAVSEAVRAADATPVRGGVDRVIDADPRAVVVDAGTALGGAIEAAIERPLLPVGDSPGIGSVPRDAVADAVRAIAAGKATVVDRQAMTLVVRGRDPAIAAYDVSLVTAEPATISEFHITTGHDTVATYRADGTVVATPAGSRGYARAVGGPIVDPAVEGLVVITIAPYRTDPDHWVVGDSVQVTVTRDESDVVAVTDGTDLGPVAPGSPITIAADRPYRTLQVPQSRSPYDAARA